MWRGSVSIGSGLVGTDLKTTQTLFDMPGRAYISDDWKVRKEPGRGSSKGTNLSLQKSWLFVTPSQKEVFKDTCYRKETHVSNFEVVVKIAHSSGYLTRFIQKQQNKPVYVRK